MRIEGFKYFFFLFIFMFKDKVMVIMLLLIEEFVLLVNLVFLEEVMLMIFVCCKVYYDGRVKSEFGFGDRVIIVKFDGFFFIY